MSDLYPAAIGVCDAWSRQYPEDDYCRPEGELADAVERLRTAISAAEWGAWLVRRPRYLMGLAQWLWEEPSAAPGRCRTPWWGRAGERGSFACDGAGVLVLPDLAPYPTPTVWPLERPAWPAALRTVDFHAQQCTAAQVVDAEALTKWLDGDEHLIGGVPFSGDLLRRWVGHALAVAPSAVKVSAGTPMSAAFFEAEQWWALAMPLRGEQS